MIGAFVAIILAIVSFCAWSPAIIFAAIATIAGAIEMFTLEHDAFDEGITLIFAIVLMIGAILCSIIGFIVWLG